MLYSMTGYGRAERNFGEKTITAELRTLNSKTTDIKLRFPGDLKEKEPELRKFVQNKTIRGKIDLLLDIQSPNGAMGINLNESLFKGYFNVLSNLAEQLDLKRDDLLQTIVRIPNVITPPTSDLNDDEWDAVMQTVGAAIDDLMDFRRREGEATAKDLSARTLNIIELAEQIKQYVPERMERIKSRLGNNLEETIGKDKVDANRFEQELIYYLERMDFSEEQMRLGQHCRYFLEKLNNDKAETGRTLNFISQEMGREINTLGAKAYDPNIQRLVVTMKDELEKIKEQLANIV